MSAKEIIIGGLIALVVGGGLVLGTIWFLTG